MMSGNLPAFAVCFFEQGNNFDGGHIQPLVVFMDTHDGALNITLMRDIVRCQHFRNKIILLFDYSNCSLLQSADPTIFLGIDGG